MGIHDDALLLDLAARWAGEKAVRGIFVENPAILYLFYAGQHASDICKDKAKCSSE